MLSMTLIPLYLILIGFVARFILRKLPEGALKRLLSRRIGG